MPETLRALSSTIAWVLFIAGWLGVLAAIAGVIGVITGLYAIPNISLLAQGAAFAGGVVCFILSACAIKLRQLLE